jgi:EAL domain-containing protein (putative c-di-GMP-specific phosphodiesterase class I)
LASIAEGVETEGQLKLLQEMNCAYIQGYLLGRPVPEEEAMRFLS